MAIATYTAPTSLTEAQAKAFPAASFVMTFTVGAGGVTVGTFLAPPTKALPTLDLSQSDTLPMSAPIPLKPGNDQCLMTIAQDATASVCTKIGGKWYWTGVSITDQGA